MSLPDFEQYPSRTYDKLRFGDTDRQGHVNNAVFTTFCETGRTHVMETVGLLSPELHAGGGATVHLSIDYRGEVFWPGTVEIGTAVKAVGRRAVRFLHGIFQNGACVATAESVSVRLDAVSRKAAPIDDATRAAFLKLVLRDPA